MLNRELWDSFVGQINAQVKGDFLSLASQYEEVTGHPFEVKFYTGNNLLFSMLEQAMMTQDKELLKVTVDFISLLPPDLQMKFKAFGQRHMSGDKAALDGGSDKKEKTGKFWGLLAPKRTA